MGVGTDFLIHKRKASAERVVQKLIWKLSTCQLRNSVFFVVLHPIKFHFNAFLTFCTNNCVVFLKLLSS